MGGSSVRTGRFFEPGAFLWGADNGMGNLGVLPAGNASGASGINSSGQVVGISNTYSGDRAFLWDAASGMTDLGVLPGGYGSYARGINDSGYIVGYTSYLSDNPSKQMSAFIWDATGWMTDLRKSLVLGPYRWRTLFSATAINSAGQIVGYGKIDGESHAFLMTPNTTHVPLPAALPLLAAALGGLVLRRRHRG